MRKMRPQPDRRELVTDAGDRLVGNCASVAFETVLNTAGVISFMVVTSASQPLEVGAAALVMSGALFTTDHEASRIEALTKSVLSGFNAFALIEMVTTFQSAPIATGELMILVAANYLILSRLSQAGAPGASAS